MTRLRRPNGKIDASDNVEIYLVPFHMELRNFRGLPADGDHGNEVTNVGTSTFITLLKTPRTTVISKPHCQVVVY